MKIGNFSLPSIKVPTIKIPNIDIPTDGNLPDVSSIEAMLTNEVNGVIQDSINNIDIKALALETVKNSAINRITSKFPVLKAIKLVSGFIK